MSEGCRRCERLIKKRALLRAALANIANASTRRLVYELVRVAEIALARDDDRRLVRKRQARSSADVAPTAG